MNEKLFQYLPKNDSQYALPTKVFSINLQLSLKYF